jgi:hypothetical protein
MTKIDIMSRSIAVNVGRRLMIFQEDAGKVFGIPAGGKEVWDASLDKSQKMRKKIEGIIGMDEHNTSPIAAARKTLQDLAGRELSGDEDSIFKVSFVVFVVCMLCDSKNPGDKESVNFWPALTNADTIHSFNWASYLVESVFSACAGAKMATRRNTPFMPPAGTALFLQVRFFRLQSTPSSHRADALLFLSVAMLLTTFVYFARRFSILTTWTTDGSRCLRAPGRAWNYTTPAPCPNKSWQRPLA